MADVPDEDEDTMSERAQAADEDRRKDEARPRWSTHFVSDRHALRAGWALGALLATDLDVEAVVDENGNYTDVLRVPIKTVWGDQVIRLRVLPEEADRDDDKPG